MPTLLLLRGHGLTRAASQRQTLEQEQRSETVAMEMLSGSWCGAEQGGNGGAMRMRTRCAYPAPSLGASAGHVHAGDRARAELRQGEGQMHSAKERASSAWTGRVRCSAEG
jgi:hypothetical protein